MKQLYGVLVTSPHSDEEFWVCSVNSDKSAMANVVSDRNRSSHFSGSNENSTLVKITPLNIVDIDRASDFSFRAELDKALSENESLRRENRILRNKIGLMRETLRSGISNMEGVFNTLEEVRKNETR